MIINSTQKANAAIVGAIYYYHRTMLKIWPVDAGALLDYARGAS